MSPDILRGYQWSRSAARYRDTSTGRFVSRTRITNLLEQNVDRAEHRLANLVQGLYNKELAPGYVQTMMRDEVRRLTLQNIALGKGGFDRLTFSDYGRAGRQLRDTYTRMTNLVRDIETGRASLPQALNRVQGYVLEARQQFFKAEREALMAAGHRFEERRVLAASEHCNGCVTYARMGWQPMGTLPLPGDGDTECGRRCRCSLERREVVEERQPIQAEREFAQ